MSYAIRSRNTAHLTKRRPTAKASQYAERGCLAPTMSWIFPPGQERRRGPGVRSMSGRRLSKEDEHPCCLRNVASCEDCQQPRLDRNHHGGGDLAGMMLPGDSGPNIQPRGNEVMRHGDRGMGGTGGGTQQQGGPFNFEQHRPGRHMATLDQPVATDNQRGPPISRRKKAASDQGGVLWIQALTARKIGRMIGGCRVAMERNGADDSLWCAEGQNTSS